MKTSKDTANPFSTEEYSTFNLLDNILKGRRKHLYYLFLALVWINLKFHFYFKQVTDYKTKCVV